MPDGIKGPIYGAINVPLAVFWAKPYEESIYREISHHAALDTAAWSGNLSGDDRLWLVGKVDTTALYGEPVAILDRQGAWLKAAAVCQTTKQNRQGYPGWILADQICFNSAYLNALSLPQAVISTPKTILFDDSDLIEAHGLLSYQTQLPILSETESNFKVCLPNGATGYLSRCETKKSTGLFFSNQDMVQQARQFMSLPYLWGGTSGFGFDCSGFVFRLYQSQGISIPRDASEQAEAGVAITKENLQPGDLLFFAKDLIPEKIHHVGMYIGEGLMIHSPNSKSVIRIEPFEAGVYGEEYWGARRYFT